MKRETLFKIITFCISLIVGLVVAEIGLRIYYALTEEPPPLSLYSGRELDDKAGWKPMPNFAHNDSMADIQSNKYYVELVQDDKGFRQYDTPRKGNKKVFFIGDSYTQSVEVSLKDTYYNIVQDSLYIDVYAYGVAGYGNLQHYYAIDEYIDEIQPDILVWQMCSNDFIDNHYELERINNYNVGTRRPYLKPGSREVYYKNPQPLNYYKKYCRLCYLFANIMHTELDPEKVPFTIIPQQGRKYKLYDESVQITEEIVRMALERVPPDVKIMVFVSDHFEPYYSDLQLIAKQFELEFVDGIPQKVEHAHLSNIPVRSADGYHWAPKGQRIVAEELIKALRPYCTQKN